MTKAMENGYEIWNMECWESVQGRFTESSINPMAKHNLDLVVVPEVRWIEGDSQPADDLYIFLWKWEC